MRRLPALAAALIIVLFSACEWPEPPLPAPNSAIDHRLLGVWELPNRQSVRLTITSLGKDRYSVSLEGRGEYNQRQVWRLEGYHTDVEGIRLVSLELKEVISGGVTKKIPDGRQHRWTCLSYELSNDGGLRPRYLAREIFPVHEGADGALTITGKQIYERLKIYAADRSYWREHLFTTDEEKTIFRKQPN